MKNFIIIIGDRTYETSFDPLENYTPPKQLRAIDAEQRMLASLRELLQKRSFAQLSIDEIATASNVTKSSFLQRFGDKETALLLLYRKYCSDILKLIEDFTIRIENLRPETIDEEFLQIVMRFHHIVKKHYAANKAMNVMFVEKGTIHNDTKLIFLKSTELIDRINKAEIFGQRYVSTNSWTANQILVTLTYNYTIGAMTAMPKSTEDCCKIISHSVLHCLTFPGPNVPRH